MHRVKKIRPLEGYDGVSDGNVVARGTNVLTHLNGNPNFTTLPLDLATLKTNIESFSALIAESLDGSKKVIAEKNKQRQVVITTLRLLGRYVEGACKNDMAIFQTSGFEPASTTKVVLPPLSEKIRKIEHGANSGQIAVWVKAVPNAVSYELRFAVVGNGGTPGAWTNVPVAIVKTPTIVTGLTPGTTYAFQARALAKDGYTDWSDSLTFICT